MNSESHMHTSSRKVKDCWSPAVLFFPLYWDFIEGRLAELRLQWQSYLFFSQGYAVFSPKEKGCWQWAVGIVPPESPLAFQMPGKQEARKAIEKIPGLRNQKVWLAGDTDAEGHVILSTDDDGSICGIENNKHSGHECRVALVAECRSEEEWQKRMVRWLRERYPLHDTGSWVASPSGRTMDLSTKMAAIVEDLALAGDQCRYNAPAGDPRDLTEMGRGFWEFAMSARPPLNETWLPVAFQRPLEARDPWSDVVEGGVVGIDFGTTSTSVAVRHQNGKIRLLRIDLTNIESKPKPKDYENPTVIDFRDFQGLETAWRQMAYRPLTLWHKHLFVSHRVAADLRDSPVQSDVYGRTMAYIKWWPGRRDDEAGVRLADLQGEEREFHPRQTRKLTISPKGLSEDYPLDPVELYAYYLGLSINTKHGIYLDYHLSYPSKYSLEVREHIRAAFERGLRRSLPAALQLHPETLERFRVQSTSSEPAAYAAAALPRVKWSDNGRERVGIEPTAAGEHYGVFDFGGGTTDFDFGIYRRPTEQEKNDGYSAVIEQIESNGDPTLGGEHLLEQLAYKVVVDNQQVCREKRLAFAFPSDARRFPGDESLRDLRSVSGRTNMLILARELRAFLEQKDVTNFPAKITPTLLDAARELQPVELTLDHESLEKLLEERIRKGIESFFDTMGLAWIAHYTNPDALCGRKIHILLAGNACKSRIVQRIIPKFVETKNKGSETFVLHQPLSEDKDNPEAPTGKTGVAIGLLMTAPGAEKRIKVISLGHWKFDFHVGEFDREGSFKSTFDGNDAVDDWMEFCLATQTMVSIGYSKRPDAKTRKLRLGDDGVYATRLDLKDAGAGKKLFVRIHDQSTIEYVVADSPKEIVDKPKYFHTFVEPMH